MAAFAKSSDGRARRASIRVVTVFVEVALIRRDFERAFSIVTLGMVPMAEFCIAAMPNPSS
jgi:hypothetical protein